MKNRSTGGLLVFLALLSLFSCVTNLAQAATINVTVNAPDELTTNSSCSLREAISNVNAGVTTYADCANVGLVYGNNDTINLPAGTYTNTIASTNENANANGDLDTLKSVAIVGAGAASTFIDGGAIDRVLHISPFTINDIVTISGVTIRNGNGGAAGGGGIHSHATLTITGSVISDNSASGNGAGILGQGSSITLIDSTVHGNANTNGTGGISLYNGTNLTVTNSTISGNTGAGGTGGISAHVVPSTVIISNSTISGNTGSGALIGGIYLGAGTLDITNSTISDNTGSTAGGILHAGTTATLRNTIVAGNTGPACNGAITNGGNNIDDGTTCGWGSTNGSMSNTDPLLGALVLNAPGATRTHALLTGSPAINGVTYSSPNGAPATDQRGIVRPQGAGYDIGAYEFVAAGPAAAASPIPTINVWTMTAFMLLAGLGSLHYRRRK